MPRIEVDFRLAQIVLDDRFRVLLDKKTRAIAGIKKGDKLATIAFREGVILLTPTHPKFVGSFTEFKFVEEQHEASRFIFRKEHVVSYRKRRARA